MQLKFCIPLLLITGLWSCSKTEIVPQRFYPRNDHEAYQHSLKQANLLTTALGQDWLKAAQKPFNNQIGIILPYQEAFVMTNLDPDAIGYRFDVRRGQRVVVNLDVIVTDSTRLFIDLFRVIDDSLSQYHQVASADSSLSLSFEPRRDGAYILRVQPELLRGGDFSIEINNVPSLEFPVAGKDKRAIQSFFGDPRDGGRREHHGVDIFAKRHTPIIAPVEADVRWVGTRGLGGKVVWLYDRKSGNNLYFAHLENQLVSRYQNVYPGDTIGTVGNTGNARYTPPHLHFGIYRNGPVDPYHFIVPEFKTPSKFIPDTTLLGKRIDLNQSFELKSAMNSWAQIIDTLTVTEEIEIVAVNHKYVRVETENGKVGFLTKAELAIQ